MVTVDEVTNLSKAALIAQLIHEQEEPGAGTTAHPLDESESFQQLWVLKTTFSQRQEYPDGTRWKKSGGDRCEACRRGDVKAVQALIAFEGVNLNAVDAYDYLPLTLVSLADSFQEGLGELESILDWNCIFGQG